MSISDTAQSFVEEFLSAMRNRMGNEKPPCANGSRDNWTCEVKSALHEMGKKRGYDCYPWLLDYIWWSMKDQRMMLAAESEFGTVGEIEEDFEKLPAFKCPRKLLVFSGDEKNIERAKNDAEKYLRQFGEHVSGEEYFLIAFTDSGTCCFWFKVPEGRNGHLKKEEVNFIPMKLAKSIPRAASAG
jgi:hypothetical protein